MVSGPKIALVLGDQLSLALPTLKAADKQRDIVLIAEVMDEATYAPHHPRKIAFVLAAMRKFAGRLRRNGWRVAYSFLDDPENTQSIPGELMRLAKSHGATGVLVTRPGEWRLNDLIEGLRIEVSVLEDTRFICPLADFEDWASGRKELRMEWFYRMMRRRTGLLMEGDKPVGGKWNYDHDNRMPPRWQPVSRPASWVRTR